MDLDYDDMAKTIDECFDSILGERLYTNEATEAFAQFKGCLNSKTAKLGFHIEMTDPRVLIVIDNTGEITYRGQLWAVKNESGHCLEFEETEPEQKKAQVKNFSALITLVSTRVFFLINKRLNDI